MSVRARTGVLPPALPGVPATAVPPTAVRDARVRAGR